MKVVDGLVDECGIGVHEVGLRLARATSLHDSPLDDREEKRKMVAENDATGKLYTFQKLCRAKATYDASIPPSSAIHIPIEPCATFTLSFRANGPFGGSSRRVERGQTMDLVCGPSGDL